MNAQSERLKVLQSVVDKQYLVEQRSRNNPNKAAATKVAAAADVKWSKPGTASKNAAEDFNHTSPQSLRNGGERRTAHRWSWNQRSGC